MVKIQRVIIIGTVLLSPITQEIVTTYEELITSCGMISIAVDTMEI